MPLCNSSSLYRLQHGGNRVTCRDCSRLHRDRAAQNSTRWNRPLIMPESYLHSDQYVTEKWQRFLIRTIPNNWHWQNQDESLFLRDRRRQQSTTLIRKHNHISSNRFAAFDRLRLLQWRTSDWDCCAIVYSSALTAIDISWKWSRLVTRRTVTKQLRLTNQKESLGNLWQLLCIANVVSNEQS